MRSWVPIALVIVTLAVGVPADAQDARRGQHVFRKCALCHVVDPTAKDLLAPPLHNVIGRRAATIPGFDYSDIMKTAGGKGLAWTPEALFYFLDRPDEFMPGTYMAFAGIEEQERRDVIAYLERLTREFQAKTRRGPTSPPPQQQPPPRKPAPQQQSSPPPGGWFNSPIPLTK